MNNDIIKKISNLLQPINKECTQHYNFNLEKLVEYVDTKIKRRDDLPALIGSNPFETVHTNHKNHAQFMYNVFLTHDAQTMYTTYIWAYRTYFRIGFSFRYFYHELTAWKEALESLNKDILSPIIRLYEYLISLHDDFVKYATSTENKLPKNIDETTYDNFLNALLKPDITNAITISNEFIKTDDDIKIFWEHIILPSLYSIGHKWAEGIISVGEEHTATSICQRVMSEHYSKIIKHIEDKKKILVTTSPNELHEVGARMLADILELNGYDVYFLSSKSSTEKKCNVILSEKIEYVVLSTTLVGNISKTKDIIKEIRSKFHSNPPKIIIGGQAFVHSEDSTKLVDADYCLSTTDQLLKILEEVK